MSNKLRARRSTQRVTMNDVAKLADVSASTVSLYLRKPDEVSAQLGKRIQSAIDTLGYVPNLMAGALAAARTRVIGVVVPSMVNAIFASTVNTMQKTLGAQGYQLLLGHSDYEESEEEAAVRTFLSWSPSAMVLTGLTHSRETRRMLNNSNVPVVEMWELGSNPLDTLVGFSHHDVGYTQARHLIEAGCQRIAFIGTRLSVDERAKQRCRGSEKAVRDLLGSQHARVIDCGFGRMAEAASRAFTDLITSHPNIDGIVFSNDMLSLGALSEAQRRGIRVPDDIAMIGFGDMDFSDCTLPSLSTIRPPREEIGEAVAQSVLRRIKGLPQEKRIDIGFELLPRQSSLRASILSHAP
ncbi:LacI family DNA-binding transcriptional regulator [Vreelandella alkaliphila]|uniref:LacI family DNA-binding transcriptional regulator n=1 Tax=Vreelandella alkaliphila TaxID=272774 RepID=A0A7C9JXG4_9GAMM|nr:LacI family DNA-binding transcriptional regulator [Halomonas alkaliphila]NDL70566.1 LacI family DNA-binding transcriptional regulator [Halomonas alkaliphila]